MVASVSLVHNKTVNVLNLKANEISHAVATVIANVILYIVKVTYAEF